MRGAGELGTLIAVAASAATLTAAPGAVRAASPACSPWAMRTVVSGLSVLEDLLPDGGGGMLLSSSSHNSIERVSPDGTVTTVLAGVNAPGAQQLRGHVVYFATGDATASGAMGTADGTVDTLDLVTGRHATYATGLVMPNGMAFDGAGNAYVTRDVDAPAGAHTGITRIPATDPAHPQLDWAALEDTNGIAVDPGGRHLYADQTFTPDSSVFRIDLANPGTITKVASLQGAGGSPVPQGLDDMTIDGDGILYVAANSGGQIIRLDPRSAEACVIASGLMTPSSLKFGRGAGWPQDHLFVVGFDGSLRELTPPAGVSITPPLPLPAAGAAPGGNAAPSGSPAPVATALAATGASRGPVAAVAASSAVIAAAILVAGRRRRRSAERSGRQC